MDKRGWISEESSCSLSSTRQKVPDDSWYSTVAIWYSNGQMAWKERRVIMHSRNEETARLSRPDVDEQRLLKHRPG